MLLLFSLPVTKNDVITGITYISDITSHIEIDPDDSESELGRLQNTPLYDVLAICYPLSGTYSSQLEQRKRQMSALQSSTHLNMRGFATQTHPIDHTIAFLIALARTDAAKFSAQ